ncbi:NAD(P)H-dependent oxidoreductase [Pelagicoccus sp. SDUM812003]|uniref:FMN-dependent NADH-azoreductase n=1 Tax=Pelagicoccus sp. SDUM812003 TaxID=3041267 RepID=UPI00280DF81F|nr:NAD(P)H-dependent oxidoreductase [Pelagicoccus sp. SDUM812003]MDQ8201501.1 NAD(P)H-dependent oxidoreductase [Pelagicoccus sp. SDUM812003]
MNHTPTVLIINGSPRGERSLSRRMASSFEESWLSRIPGSKIITRNVGVEPPPFVSEKWIAAVFTPPEERNATQRELLAYSDQAISELKAADVLVLATPMHNYGVPAAVKAWVDQVVRVGETFSFDLGRGDFPLEPILSGKRMVTLTTSGEFGFTGDGIRADWNHLHPHIEVFSRYFGVSHSWQEGIEYQEFGDQRFEDSKAKSFAAIPVIVDEVISSYQQEDKVLSA